ncbi:MAG: putative ATP:guanido phosphotransferase [Candidatus Hydrogenedentes bacterium ADurb.Bin179]|nr:MAG: putative ATP:guanido phosphotransferase [Candidatus Hydrogenedentes bacterium ADurb.Bin179]
MSPHQLAEYLPRWISAVPNTPEPVVLYQSMLARNLVGFAFPWHSPDTERQAVESLILNALTRAEGIPAGRYHSVSEMDITTQRFLAERRLAPVEFLQSPGTRGLYISEDQSVTLIVNMVDHLLIRVLSGGGTAKDIWSRTDTLDTALGKVLDYAFHDRLGYLTSSLRMAGTGLRVSVVVHLPALALLGEEARLAAVMEQKRLAFNGLSLGESRGNVHGQTSPSPPGDRLAAEIEPVRSQSLYMDVLGALQIAPEYTVGNLFVLSNQDTLGLSETETCLQLDQAIALLAREEETARERLLNEQRGPLMDRIGRALGIAQSARLLGMGETLMLASMIRLAATMGLVTGCNRNALNQALLECQQAHLQIARGLPAEPCILAGERARMFRALFAATEMN